MVALSCSALISKDVTFLNWVTAEPSNKAIVGALPVSTYMMYSYFKQLPNELIEAARVDGASNMKIFRRIVMLTSFPAFYWRLHPGL